MRKSFNSFQEFWSHFEGVLSEMGFLEEGEWAARSEKELQFASFPYQYHAEWDVSIPGGKLFRLRLTGDRDVESEAITSVRWDQVFTLHKDGMITRIEDGKVVRTVTESHAAAVAACNAAGYNIYNPFGLMDR